MRRTKQYEAMPVGIVVRRVPGVTRWARYAWRAVAALPGAGPADWRELRREGDAVEYHAATPVIELFGTDTEAYVHGLGAREPSIYVVMRTTGNPDQPYDILLATASPYEAQDYDEGGEEIVEKVPMPPTLRQWVEDFVSAHHVEEEFRKRRRDRVKTDLEQDGIGDARIAQTSDVYRSPRSRKERLQ